MEQLANPMSTFHDRRPLKIPIAPFDDHPFRLKRIAGALTHTRVPVPRDEHDPQG
jgi:hypothetical protein